MDGGIREGGDIRPKHWRALCSQCGRDGGGTRGERSVIDRGIRRDDSMGGKLRGSETGGREIRMGTVPSTAHGESTESEGCRH